VLLLWRTPAMKTHNDCISRGVGVIHDIGYDLPDLTKDFWHGVSVRAVKKDGATSRVFWRTYVHIGAEFPGL